MNTFGAASICAGWNVLWGRRYELLYDLKTGFLRKGQSLQHVHSGAAVDSGQGRGGLKIFPFWERWSFSLRVGIEMISGFLEESILNFSSGFLKFNFPSLKIEALYSSEMHISSQLLHDLRYHLPVRSVCCLVRLVCKCRWAWIHMQSLAELARDASPGIRIENSAEKSNDLWLTRCGRVTQICVFNTMKLGTSASSP